ncbi:putative aarF domain-containing protein [Vigna angularis]|uniref:Putative aarF domain-containing protein n=1 Tax=Phaseolus angularis TaxID=3914 RepID=A0A8T0K3Q9_PHAAN|nr:putative aarF domain-containing protein [Vigna angularis]
MAVSGLRSGGLPLFHHHHHCHHLRFLQSPPSFAKFNVLRSKSKKGFTVFARYAQARDLFSSRRFQDSMEKLPKLVEDIVETSLNTGPRGVLRLAQGVQAFIGVGQEWLTDISKSANTSAGLQTEMQLGLLTPFYLRRLFERMGATYIKLGQFIASAPTLFPPEYVQEFQNCFDRAPPVPFEDIESILRKELGKPLESVYEYIDPTPIASASIAQVHGARLKGSQEDVVIKVLKPGIEDILVADLNFVYVVARILEFLSPEISRTSLGVAKATLSGKERERDISAEDKNCDGGIVCVAAQEVAEAAVSRRDSGVGVDTNEGGVQGQIRKIHQVGIVKDIRESMLEEVDFYKEAANIEAFRRYLEAMGLTGNATAPRVYQYCSAKKVLTMQRLYGVPLTDLDSISSLVSNPETSLITALNVWFGSLLGCESFHADVHAGNLWLLRDGRIGFLDFGIVGRISPKTWAAMEVFLGSIAIEDYDSMASALIEMGATNKDIDTKAFARDLEKELDTEIVVATTSGTATNSTTVAANIVFDERQMNALFLDVVRVSESYGLKFPREFALLLKQLLYFDRYTRLLAPNLNMLQDQRISIASNRRRMYRDNY